MAHSLALIALKPAAMPSVVTLIKIDDTTLRVRSHLVGAARLLWITPAPTPPVHNRVQPEAPPRGGFGGLRSLWHHTPMAHRRLSADKILVRTKAALPRRSEGRPATAGATSGGVRLDLRDDCEGVCPLGRQRAPAGRPDLG